MKIYQKISWLINKIEVEDNDWPYIQELDSIVKEYLPSGSGFNYEIETYNCNPERLVFLTSYASMDEHGYYGPVIDVEFIVTPSLQFEFDLEIRFLNYPELKEDYDDYFGDTWFMALDQHIKEEEN